MWQFFLSGLRIGIRGRSFHAVLTFGTLLIGIAYLSASFSPRQPQTVALDIGFSGLRITLVLLSLFWVQELVTREIDRRIILFSLTYPVPRSAFVLGRFLAIITLVSLAAIVLGLALGLAVLLTGGGYGQEFPVQMGWPFVLALIGFVIDVAVVTSVCLCVAMLSTVAIMPLAIGMGFAIAGKALGATLEYLNAGADGDAELLASVGRSVKMIGYIVPDLSRLDWREWSMYGLAPDGATAIWACVMAVAYIAILLGMAVHLLEGREFS